MVKELVGIRKCDIRLKIFKKGGKLMKRLKPCRGCMVFGEF